MKVLKWSYDVKIVEQICRIFNNGENYELHYSVFSEFIITVMHNFDTAPVPHDRALLTKIRLE